MKKQVFKLDPDDFEDEGEDLAYLFFHTTAPGYLFVDDINHLYRLSLARLDDLQIDGQNWPLYSYHDSLRQLDYFLIERPLNTSHPSAPHWVPGHKMMIIKGERAANIADFICEDFSTPPSQPDACLPTGIERYDILTSYQQSLTPVTVYSFNTPVGTSKKLLKERTEMENLFTTILDLLDLSGIE